ncbi:MAG: gliding motility-associated C-terminal domain-containing protein [Chitinophagales bacterium]|nr:gliding motility-associated C-terminal domain-containing protein [Bacteroidota bacterium]MBK8486651.1 gliding motility-associated C-terminal domain-containing protein [Bacteroidota bacterium]
MKRVFLPIIISLIFSRLGAQSIVISEDTLICSGTPANLYVVSAKTVGTEDYLLEYLDYAPEDYTGTNVGLSDDSYGGPYSIGFTFCFMGNSYTHFYIGSNGWVSFGGAGALATTYTSASIPSTGGSVPKNCIMGPWQDWHPGIAGGPYIKYHTIGAAPNRKLVVSWNNVPMYSCTTTYGKFQIVLNETSNIIDNHITNKEYCAWADGTATQGLHNLAGTFAYVFPGRNSSVWEATDESSRYLPIDTIYDPEVTWTTLAGTLIGTGDNITVNPIITTSYVASINVCGGLNLLDTMVVNVMENNADFSFSTTDFCPDGSISPSFIETPGGIFTIEPTTIPINSATGELDIEDAASGSYYIAYTTPADPCSFTHGESINIVAYPDATIAYADTVVCAFGSVLPTLITTIGGTFSISPTGSATINSSTGSVGLSTAIIGTTYTVSYTTSGLCQSTSTFSFSIRPFDDATFEYDDDSYCPYGTAIPVSIALDGGTFTSTPATLDIDAVTGEIDLSLGTSGTTYFITYTTDGGSCSNSETVTVLIDPLDVATFGYGATSFCAGGTVNPTFITTSGGDFSVSPATLSVNSSTGAIDLTTGTVGAFYNITYTTPDGPCQNSSTITISINANDDSTFAYLDYIYCAVGSAMPSSITTSGGAFSISPSGLSINSTTGALTLGGSTPGTYTVTYTTPSGFCSSSSSHTITIDQFIDAYFYYDSAAYCNYGNITPYIMNPGGNFVASTGISINATSGTINLLASTPGGPYSVFYNSPGCTEQDTFLITVYPDPVLTLSFDDIICIEGEPVLLLGTPTGGVFSGSGVSGNYFNPEDISEQGTYVIHYFYTDANGCVNDITDIIQVVKNSVFAGDDITIIENNIIQLNAEGGVIFEWKPPYGLSCTGCQNPAAQPYITTEYTVTSYDEYGCVATDIINVTVLLFDDLSVFVPNAFTPNNDGLNDYLFAYGSDIAEIESFSVYDRWGSLVYQATNLSPDAVNMGWDGTINGSAAQAGVYAFIIEVRFTFGGSKVVKGNSTILR